MKKNIIKDQGILKILDKFDVDLNIPQNVIDELKTIPKEVSKSDKKDRTDLTDELIITIDGDDTKDIDDGVSLKILPNNNFYLGVHIADVTHYVRENHPLDRMSLQQATSIYPVNTVVPMLPKELSNGICSLNPNVERLALSCFMEIDYTGNIVEYKILETVIKSKYKMTYTAVNEMIENKNEIIIDKYKDIYPMLLEMKKLTSILSRKRTKRGSLDFSCPETKFCCDDNGTILKVKPYDRNSATNLIEEFMIVCNETIATHCFNKSLPFLYRIHEEPDKDKMEILRQFLIPLGYELKGFKIKPKELQKLLLKLKDTSEENAVNHLLLRSMAKAVYSSEKENHFGLASECYCHFTSPIRRYPDLQIHRIIKADLNNKMDYKTLKDFKNIVETVDTHCSNREQLSQKIERESIKLKSAEYMFDKIGEEYTGVISGINECGFYVQLPNTIEGFVNISSLKDDLYIYDECKLLFIGEKTRKVFALGTAIDIVVKNVNIATYQIDFSLVTK